MYKLDQVTGKDELRPVMQHVFIDKYGATASDAHVLVHIPKRHLFLNQEIPEMFIKAKDWKHLMIKDFDHLEYKEPYLVSVDKFGLELSIIKPIIDTTWRYPLYQNVKPKKEEQIDKIGVDIAFFDKIKKAIDCNDVKLTLHGKSRAILINPIDEDYKDIWAIIMPKMLND